MKRFFVVLGALVILLGALFLVTQHPQLFPKQLPGEPTTWEEWIKAYTPTYVTSQKKNKAETEEIDAKWEKWIDEQTEKWHKEILNKVMAPEMQEEWKHMTPEAFEAALREALRAQVTEKSRELKQGHPEPPLEQVGYSLDFELDLGRIPSQKHEGPQTVEALMASFDEKYSRAHPKAPQIDEKYPRNEWLQMYIHNGWVLKDYDDYIGALALRWDVERAKNNPKQWTSGTLDIPPTDDWDTYKAAYIAAIVRIDHRIHDAIDADPEIVGGYTPYSHPDVFLPNNSRRVYVRRNGLATEYFGTKLTDKQHFNLTHRGIDPEGIEVIYIDDDYNFLKERPPLITREMVTEIPLPPEDWQPPPGWVPPVGLEEALRAQGWTGSFNLQDETPQQAPTDPQSVPNNDFVEQAESNAQAAQARFESTQREIEKFTEMSDAEFEAELEKLLTQEIPERPTVESIEMAFRKQFAPERFSPERLNRAMETLSRHGPEDGLRKLRKNDPEIAEQVARTLRLDPPPTDEEAPPVN